MPTENDKQPLPLIVGHHANEPARRGESLFVTVSRSALHEAIADARRALAGDSNDAEHDALNILEEKLTGWETAPACAGDEPDAIAPGGHDTQIELHVANAVQLLNRIEEPLDLVLCDPPYGLGWDKRATRHQYARNEQQVLDGYQDVPPEHYMEFSRRWIAAAAAALRPGGQLVIVNGPQRAAHVQLAAEEQGLDWVCTIAARRNFIAASTRRPTHGATAAVRPAGSLAASARTRREARTARPLGSTPTSWRSSSATGSGRARTR
jgi:DNA methylase